MSDAQIYERRLECKPSITRLYRNPFLNQASPARRGPVGDKIRAMFNFARDFPGLFSNPPQRIIFI